MTLIYICFGAFFLAVAGIYLIQRQLIYYPRVYLRDVDSWLPEDIERLRYETRDGRQTAFYIRPRDASLAAPRRLWIFFGGNGSLALDWLDLVEEARRDDTGYLLVDYPGYGDCAGRPTQAGIQRNAEGAFVNLAERLGVAPAKLGADLNVLGHSLGAAAALQFAVRRPTRQAVLLAPFTSMVKMARTTVGWPLCQLVKDRFDNVGCLARLARRETPPVVWIFHGEADVVIPVRMARRLARRFPEIVRYQEIPQAGHNSLMHYGRYRILAVLRGETDGADDETE